MMPTIDLISIIEALFLTAGEPVTVARIQQCFEEDTAPDKDDIMAAINDLKNKYEQEARTYFIKEIASGYILQVRQEYSQFIARLWEEKPARYTRAYLETLVIIAYRQPVTRAEIEEIRGVAVSSSIMKTLQDRDWIKVVGHRDVPGKPGIFGTTKTFLDYFNLKSLDELPSLKEVRDLDQIAERLQEQFELGALEAEGQNAVIYEEDESMSQAPVIQIPLMENENSTQVSEEFESEMAVDLQQDRLEIADEIEILDEEELISESEFEQELELEHEMESESLEEVMV